MFYPKSLPRLLIHLLSFAPFVHEATGALVIKHKCFSNLEFQANGGWEVNFNSLVLRLSETTTSKGHGSGKERFIFQRGVKPLPLHPKTKKKAVCGLAQCWPLISRELCRYLYPSSRYGASQALSLQARSYNLVWRLSFKILKCRFHRYKRRML